MKYEELGKYIKFKREALGISLNKFAVEAEIESSVLSRIENLKQGIKLNTLINIAKGFNKTPAEFLAEFEKF